MNVSSKAPYGVVEAIGRLGVVGVTWPPVMPYVKLFTQTTIMSALRRAAWMKWLPPMALTVAVAGVDHHLHVRPGELEARRERDGAAVRRVERVELHVAGDAAGAADAGDDRDLLQVEARTRRARA